MRGIWQQNAGELFTREVSGSVHANTDERRHLGGSTSLNGAEDCIQKQAREVADNGALKYMGAQLLNLRLTKR